MQTVVISAADTNAYASAVESAARALRDGHLVVFPTETVYGVAANAASPVAVARLRELKGRSAAQPFTVHLGQRSHARRYLTSPSPLVRRLVRKVWPGPLTLVCEETHPEQTDIATQCPAEQLGAIYHQGTVGLRCPDHAAAARLLTLAEVPVVASSANAHGSPPPLDAQEALSYLDGRVRYVIDAGRTRHNVASTVVEVRGGTWRLLRSGALDERTLERLAWSTILFVCTGNSCRSPMAEMLFRQELARRLGCAVDELDHWGYRVLSAGTGAPDGAAASSGALQEMRRRGFDLSAHRGQPLTVELIHRAERVYVMTEEHRRAVLELVPGAAGRTELLDPDGPVADPFGGLETEYERCARQIERAVAARVEEFLNEDRNW